MPGGRGRGLRQNQSVAEIFNDPAVVAKQGGNPWDSYDEWAKPTSGNEQLRNYLTGSNYWGYKDWKPMANPGPRSLDPRSGLWNDTPEFNAFRRLLKQTGPGDKANLIKQMEASYRKATGQDYGKSFSLLDQLRFMEERGTKIRMSATQDWQGNFGGGDYDRFNNVTGGVTGGGGQEGGGKGGVGNMSLSPGGSTGPTWSQAPIAPRPQPGPQTAASNPWGQQRYTQSRGPSRALGPRSPIRQSGRSLSELFNPFGR